jgi:outer membrane immunogenic protein
MSRLSIALIAFVSTVAFTQTATAADLPRKGPVAPAVVAPVWNWTGFYIGGNVGGVWQRDDGDSNFTNPIAPFNNPQSNSISDSSVIGGFQIGYNWQFSNWVLGLEGDWSWLKTSNSFCRQTDISSLACSDNGSGFLTLTSETDWIATVRGRIGFTWDRFLVYGTGGVAWGNVDTSINANCLVFGCGVSPTVCL